MFVRYILRLRYLEMNSHRSQDPSIPEDTIDIRGIGRDALESPIPEIKFIFAIDS